jgi:hypothetical protein
MPGVPALTGRNLLIAQSLLAALFFLIGLASERLVSNSFLTRRLVPFLTSTTPTVYLAYFCWLTVAAIAFIVWGRLRVAAGQGSHASGQASQSKWFDCLFLQLLVSLILLTRCLQFPIAYDDSYIDYRYVHNLVWHHSFDYNPGLHVMGFTSHLHLWLLAALSALFHNDDIALISQQLNALCQCVSVLLLYGFVKKHLSAACAVIAGLLFAIDAFMITECAYGKETSIVVLLILVALIAHEKKKQTLYAWANSLLFVARPEGIIWLGAALGIQMWEKRRVSALKPWILPLSVVACWVIFLVLYFGTLVPHGAVAKTRIYPRRPIVATAVEVGTVVSNFIAPLSLQNGGHPLREYAAIKSLHSSEAYLFVVIAGVVVLSTLIWLGYRYRWLRVYSWGAGCLAGFFVVTNPAMFSWYYCWFALIPMLMGPCLVSIVARRLANVGGGGGGKTPNGGRSAVVTSMSGAVSMARAVYLVVIPICQAPYEVPALPFPVFVWEDHQQRLLSLLEATMWVKSNYGNSKLLAVLEPGIIGYYYEGPVLDLDGLVSDEMLKYYPLKPGLVPSGVIINIPVPAIHDLSPAWLIFFDRIGYNLMLDPAFQSRYVQRKNYPEHFGLIRSTCVFQLREP